VIHELVSKQETVKRQVESKVIPLDEVHSKKDEASELAEIAQSFRKYVTISSDYSMIEQFKCPVEGCGWETDQGPGALRMHILITADPNVKGRYNPNHEEFLKTNPNEMTLDGVRYLAQFPSSLHLDTSIKHLKE
jgi:hypothetical protein